MAQAVVGGLLAYEGDRDRTTSGECGARGRLEYASRGGVVVKEGGPYEGRARVDIDVGDEAIVGRPVDQRDIDRRHLVGQDGRAVVHLLEGGWRRRQTSNRDARSGKAERADSCGERSEPERRTRHEWQE